MAQFNVSPGQPNDPNYMNWFQPVNPSIPNKGTGMALATAGEGIEGAAKVIDTSVKLGLSDTIDKAVDSERDQFTSALEKVKSQLDQGAIAAPARTMSGSTTGGKSVLDAYDQMEDSDLPVGLSGGLDRIEQLTMARAAASPKLNDTQYAANTLAIAKQLRAQYPGYRDYIDQKVSQASGLPVANSYYSNLMLDINRQLMQQSVSSKQNQMENIMKSAMTAGAPNMDVYMMQRANNDPKYPGDAFVLKQASSWYNLKATQEIQAKQREANKDDRTTQIQTETTNLTKNSNNFVSHMIEDNIAMAGMPTSRDLLTYFQDAAAGRTHPSDAEVQQRYLQLQAYRGMLYNQMHNMSTGSAAIIGADQAEDVINKALSPIDTWIKLANDKDGPLAMFHLHQNQAIQADSTNNLLTNKDTGALARQLMSARQVYGDQYFPIFAQGILANGQDLDKPIRDLFTETAMNAVKPVEDSRGQPVETYMKKAIEDAKAKNVNDFNYYGKVVGLIGSITSPSMPDAMKDQLIHWAFQPKNIGILDGLKQDYKDPRTGEWIPGKSAAFDRMTSPAISSAVAATSKLRPQNYIDYKNYAESEFGSVLRSDVASLSQQQGKIFVGVNHATPWTFGYGWNNDTKQLSLVDGQGRPLNPQAEIAKYGNDVQAHSQIMSVFDTLNRVNRGLSNLNTVYNNDPSKSGDVDSYLMNKLRTLNFAPTQNPAQNDIMRAIFKSQRPEMTMQDIDKVLFGNK